MFWRKKEFELSVRASYQPGLSGNGFKRFLAYKVNDAWRGLVGFEEHQADIQDINTTLNLILDHLKLKVQEEKTTTEPAKLVEEKDYMTDLGDFTWDEFTSGWIADDPKPKRKYTKRKKKPGRPKGSKNKK